MCNCLYVHVFYMYIYIPMYVHNVVTGVIPAISLCMVKCTSEWVMCLCILDITSVYSSLCVYKLYSISLMATLLTCIILYIQSLYGKV